MRASPQQLFSIGARSGPLYLQIYHRIRGLILSGAWPAGTQLPSSRALASDLGISRNTAILAIEKLVADGWIVSRAGSGIYVSSEAPPARPRASLAAAGDLPAAQTPLPFEISQVGTDLFPVDVWSRMQRKVWSQAADVALHEGSETGWLPLRRAVAGYLSAVRGVLCAPEQVLILSSTQAALDLTVRVLGQGGDSIWVEDPGYPYAREAFHAHGLELVPLPVDSGGIRVSEGLRSAPRARFAYVTAACQFPTCAILAPQRRAELLSWAADSGGYILEDDWDFNAVFDGQPPEPIAASVNDSTIYIHSFNRLLFPALRIAALVVPPALVDRFSEGRRVVDGFPNMANQIALTRFIEEGFLSSHLRRCRQAYRERRSAMHAGIHEHLHQWARVDGDRPGFHALAWTGGHADSSLALAARCGGIACLALSDFSFAANDTQGALVLGFAAFPVDVIQQVLPQLGRAISESL